MVFSSITFLFFFLPIVLAGYYCFRTVDARNRWLLAASLVFYIWGGGSFVFILLASIILNYFFGLGAAGNKKQRRLTVIGSIFVNIGLLGYYKYINFFMAQWNALAESFGIGTPVAWDSVLLPIGISFFTFHSMSYVFDVAMGRCQPQRNFTRFALYITCFPQLIAGPIIRYHDIADQLPKRDHSMSLFYEGMIRFIHGLAKKVVIADSVGAIAEAAFYLPPGELTTSAAWLGAFAYTMQIYFDFSAYSDMAIGLAKMFGLTFPENFRRPYSALSITDFWRRWHITLSNWIREYLYIPLGGSRVSKERMYVNLLIVFFLTGLWHGANWTFILWGLYHGALLIAERITGNRLVEEGEVVSHAPLRRASTLLLVLIGWVLFRAETVDQAMLFYQHMLAFDFSSPLPLDIDGSLTNRNVITLLLASLVFIMPQRWQAVRFLAGGHPAANAYRWFLLLVALPITIMLIVAGTFSPFLYFQF